MGISVWRKLDCYCLLRILEIRMNPQIGYVARQSDSIVFQLNMPIFPNKKNICEIYLST